MHVGAAAPEPLLKIPSGSEMPGGGAGQTNNVRGMGANPETGHIYAADLNNSRIDEFTAWGEFVRAWGWDVAPEGAFGDTVSNEFEVCTTVCKAGVAGTGVGQIGSPWGVAVDSLGSVWVYEAGAGSRRVQKFTGNGSFQLMVGGGVNQGPVHPGDLCTAQHVVEGDSCGAGSAGTACRQFSNSAVTTYITYNALSDTVFVGDVDRILELNLDGSCKAQIPFEGELAAFDGKAVRALVADAESGDLYVGVASTANVARIDRITGEVFDELSVASPFGLATNIDGNVYAVDKTEFSNGRVLGFDSTGAPIAGMEQSDEFPNESGVQINSVATNLKCPKASAPNEAGDLYVSFFSSGTRSYIRGYGPPPICFGPPPEKAPEIASQFAVSVDTGGAVVKAQINPNFWPDTTYYVQYGAGACSAGSCAKEQPVPPGALLTAKSTNSPVTTAGVFLGDLASGTTYHYRFVARSGGGGPVRGVGGTEVLDGTEGTFTTFVSDGAPPVCPANDFFRVGPSEQLPNCRAYELVSPLEKNNADVLTQLTISGYPTAVNQSARSGQRFTYSSGTAFGDPASAPFVSQYIADRHPTTGWASLALAPRQTRAVVDPSIDNEYRFFSPDLCSGWLQTEFDPPAAPGGILGYRNLYRRDTCGGGFEALSTTQSPHLTPAGYGIRPQGGSADGSRSIFVANDDLPGTGAPSNVNKRLQLYEHSKEGLRFVCLLPSGNATLQGCSAGTADEDLGAVGTEQIPNYSRAGSFQNAISTNGDRIFWTESGQPGPGRIFVRFAAQPRSERVSQSVSGAKARFWGAAADGSRAIFAFEDAESAQDGNLYSFDVGTANSTLIAGQVDGVLGIAEDALRVYFVSREAIAGLGQNSEGVQAVAGQPNLYLFEDGPGSGGSYHFVAPLPATGVRLSSIATSPFLRTSRVTPDGRHAAFMSSAPLTGFDNTDAVSGKADAEVFLYKADGRQLRCVSCNPSGARPTGVDIAADDVILGGAGAQIWTAAQIPTWERPFYASRVLSDHGDRLFFESFEALVPWDTNGVQDVYQWEAQGSGDCDSGDSGFSAESGGCVALISSGESPRESSFLDASPSGDDVFIATLSSLVAPDYGLVDVYDARVGGGIAYPQAKVPCEGEACQSPPAPPADPTPASSSFRGAGNVKRPPRCPKGKRRVKRNGKSRCVKKKRGKQQRASRRSRGAAR